MLNHLYYPIIQCHIHRSLCQIFSKIGHYWRRTGNIAHSILKDAVSVAASKDGHIVVSDLRGEGDDATVYRINLQGGDKYEVSLRHFGICLLFFV